MADDDLKWYHITVCDGLNVNWFYDAYESDPVLAQNMDTICLACPARAMCLREGVENNESGLWGGVFLVNGKADPAKNAHKTDEVWSRIRGDIIG